MSIDREKMECYDMDNKRHKMSLEINIGDKKVEKKFNNANEK